MSADISIKRYQNMQMSADISIKRYQNMQMHAYIFKKKKFSKGISGTLWEEDNCVFLLVPSGKKSHTDYANTIHRVFSHTEVTEITEAHMLIIV